MMTIFQINAEPMDMRAADMLPPLKAVIQQIQSGTPATPEAMALVHTCLQSGDPVLVSLAAWSVTLMGIQGDEFRPELEKLAPRKGEMAYAFVTLAREVQRSRDQTKAEKITRLQRLTDSDNAILNVEAAKAVVRIDPAAGRKLLDSLAKQSRGQTAVEASRALTRLDAPEASSPVPPLPYSDEKYETVLSVLGEATVPR